MPQFDTSSFIIQLIWLFFSFLSFYFIFSLNVLPFWGNLMKIRNKTTKSLKNQNKIFENSMLIHLVKCKIHKNDTSNKNYF